MSKQDSVYSQTSYDLIGAAVTLVDNVIAEAPEGAKIYAQGIRSLITELYYGFPQQLQAIYRVNDPRELPVARVEAMNVLDSYLEKITAQIRMYDKYGKEPRLLNAKGFVKEAFSADVNDAVSKRRAKLGG